LNPAFKVKVPLVSTDPDHFRLRRNRTFDADLVEIPGGAGIAYGNAYGQPGDLWFQPITPQRPPG
jgi:hypothetical protein